ncbi:hypothetical protein [Kutzneria chonburiensis]|uniref:Uncharacterized protein n=1 Tax=Kutzneria chonburiensis TaxID=1483604 RepID=A0ABV6MZH2_9PSEU|nr:hypothetical protein [Kutzneria chonburiensis]
MSGFLDVGPGTVRTYFVSPVQQWRVTNITKQADGFRQFDAVNVDTGAGGYLSGPGDQKREVR